MVEALPASAYPRFMSRAATRSLLLAAALSMPGGASAELVVGARAQRSGTLGQQVLELSQSWSRVGRVTELAPRLLHGGEQLELPWMPSQNDFGRLGCVTIAALGTTNLVFHLMILDEKGRSSERAWPIPSAAGVAAVTRCGKGRASLRRLAIQLGSRRGILQFVVLESAEPPPAIEEVLPGRDPGPSRTPPEIGSGPTLAPLASRLEGLRKAELESGATVREESVRSDGRGRGTRSFGLAPGCYRFGVLAPNDLRAPPDVDARLVAVGSDEVLALDQEHAGQASLSHCVARFERVRLEYHGAPPQAQVVILEARWTIPDTIPEIWGSQARQGLARELLSRGHLALPSLPIDATLGVRGRSRWTVQVAPEACYIAALAPLRGRLTRVAIRVDSEGSLSAPHQDDGRSGSALTFCSEGRSLVQVEVGTAGTALTWIAALWPLSGTP